MEAVNAMPGRWEMLYKNMIAEIEKSKSGENPGAQKNINEIIGSILKTMNLLKSEVTKNDFADKQEEIIFFKQIKPRFHCQLIYWTTVHSIDLYMPVGGDEAIEKYFRQQLLSLQLYFSRHMDFYSYYRGGQTFMDQIYFLRERSKQITNSNCIDRDPVFSTSHDYFVTRILSNEMLKDYLQQSIEHLRGVLISGLQKQKSTSLKWTASKAGLVELIYALQSGGVYNNGLAEIKEIASQFEKLFGVELGNYYHVFNEIRLRKKNRSQLLDHLKEKLTGKMDAMDEK